MDIKLVIAGLLIGIWLSVLILTPSTGLKYEEPNMKLSKVDHLILKGIEIEVIFKDVEGVLYPRSFNVKRKGEKVYIEGTRGTVVVGKLKTLELKGIHASIKGEGILEELSFDGVELKMNGNFKIRSLLIKGARFVAEDLRIEDAERIVVKSAVSEGEIFLKLSKVCEVSIKDGKRLKISANRKDLLNFKGGE